MDEVKMGAADVGVDQTNPLTSVPIEISVSVGRARPLVKDLLKLERDSVLTLDKRLEDPVELYVGDRLIGIGALEVVEDDEHQTLAVRVTEVIALQSPVA